MVGTPELLAKISKKRGIVSQVGTGSRAQLRAFAQAIFKVPVVRPVIVQLLNRVFRERFKLEPVRSV